MAPAPGDNVNLTFRILQADYTQTYQQSKITLKSHAYYRLQILRYQL